MIALANAHTAGNRFTATVAAEEMQSPEDEEPSTKRVGRL